MAGESGARRLRSAFDVFDFVSNAIDSGVKKAKHSQNKALREFTEGAEKLVKPIVEDVKEMAKQDDVKKVIDEVKTSIDNLVEDVEKSVKTTTTTTKVTETTVEKTVEEEVPTSEHTVL